ncbi:hypothetical protein CPB85DRAFT_1562959 [Mucidula mucida]|nr:hypothetical protein CPB85DRAFT_1562959 [Mucidula mucida]
MIYHALIRTHRISSKKKIRSLRAAAAEHDVGDLIHVGVPGIMYVSGAKEDNYHLAVRVEDTGKEMAVIAGRLDAVESVKDFGEAMQEAGLWEWWREGMGYD